MDRAQQFASSHVGGNPRWGAAVAALIWAAALMGEAAAQPGDLFTPASPGPANTRLSSIAPDPMAARRRIVTIDFGLLTPPDFALASPANGTPADALSSDGPTRGRLLRLNLFDDAVFTGLVERIEPTFSGGHALSGRLVDVGPGHDDAGRRRRSNRRHGPDAGRDLPDPVGGEWAARGQPGRSGAASASGRTDIRSASGWRWNGSRAGPQRATAGLISALTYSGGGGNYRLVPLLPRRPRLLLVRSETFGCAPGNAGILPALLFSLPRSAPCRSHHLPVRSEIFWSAALDPA